MRWVSLAVLAVLATSVGCSIETQENEPLGLTRQPLPSGYYEVNSHPTEQAWIDQYQHAVGMRLPDNGAIDPIAAHYEYLVEEADPAICTATLISERTMISAGHCNFEPGHLIVFEYARSGGVNPSYTDGDLIYRVEQVLESQRGFGEPEPLDYTLFTLEKTPISGDWFPAPGHRFGALELSTSVSTGESVAFIGHAADLNATNCPNCPAKLFKAGSVVADASIASFLFRFDFRVYGGMSGSPILNDDGRIVGLVRGSAPGGGLHGVATRISSVFGVSANIGATTCSIYDHGAPVDWAFCTAGCPCEGWEGDCDVASDCDESLVCAQYGSTPYYGGVASNDICVDPACPSFNPQDPDWTPGCKLPAAEGDCDTDADCLGFLICKDEIGKAVHHAADSTLDVCDYPPDPGCSANSCSSSCPCGLGEGDCNSDSDCRPGLFCYHNVGGNFGRGASVDICSKPSAEAPTCDSNSDCSSTQKCMAIAGICTEGEFGDLCEDSADCDNQADCCDGSENCAPGDLGCQCHMVCD